MTISFTFSRKESKSTPSIADGFLVYRSILRFSRLSIVWKRFFCGELVALGLPPAWRRNCRDGPR